MTNNPMQGPSRVRRASDGNICKDDRRMIDQPGEKWGRKELASHMRSAKPQRIPPGEALSSLNYRASCLLPLHVRIERALVFSSSRLFSQSSIASPLITGALLPRADTASCNCSPDPRAVLTTPCIHSYIGTFRPRPAGIQDRHPISRPDSEPATPFRAARAPSNSSQCRRNAACGSSGSCSSLPWWSSST